MNRKFRSLVGGAAVAGLALAGAVAAAAADSETIVKVGYFEVQGKNVNVEPAAWFSEGDDDVAALSIGADALELAASAKSVGINKIVDVDFDATTAIAIDATGSAKYSIVLTSDDVDYLRLTADATEVDADTTWSATGYWKDDARTPSTASTISQTLAEWAGDSNPWEAGNVLEGATVHQIGARHFSGEGAGSVSSLTFGDTKYVFGATAFDQDDVDAAVNAAEADHAVALAAVQDELDTVQGQLTDTQAELDAANDKVAELDAANAALQEADAKIAKLEADLKAAEEAAAEAGADNAKLEKAAAKSSNQALKARALLPYKIAGKAKVGQTLRAKGKKFKGVSVSYQWRVGKKNAGKKATLKLKKRHAGKVVRLTVTKSYQNAAGKTVNVKKTVRALKVDRVTR